MPRIANRPLTKPREPHRLGDLLQVIAAIGLLILPALLYASQRARLHQVERQIGTLEQTLLDLQDRRRMLEIELASEGDPRRISDKAAELADLGEPVSEQVKYLQRLDRERPVAVPTAGATDGHP